MLCLVSVIVVAVPKTCIVVYMPIPVDIHMAPICLLCLTRLSWWALYGT
jgi:hypothetical protein